jgi:hypothetical protein
MLHWIALCCCQGAALGSQGEGRALADETPAVTTLAARAIAAMKEKIGRMEFFSYG